MNSMKKRLKEPAHDLRFLLNRGYRKKRALEFVAGKYLLSVKERNYLARSVFSSSISLSRINKLVDISHIRSELILVDGYNVLITFESIYNEDYDSIILCDDGVIRDLNAVFGKYSYKDSTKNALNCILSILRDSGKLIFFFDKHVSFSGKLSKLTEELIHAHGLTGEAILSKNVDYDIIKLSQDRNAIVATSDSVIMDKVGRILDLPSYYLNSN